MFAVLDDTSKFSLAILEVDSAATKESIWGMQLALRYGRGKQCISDHGSQFTSNNVGVSDFAAFLEKEGIKILCRIKNPQYNGKVEISLSCIRDTDMHLSQLHSSFIGIMN